MADARIIIDADAGDVVAEAGKAKAAVASLGDQTRRSSKAGAAFSAAGAKQVETLQGLGRAARRASFAVGALGTAGFAVAIKDGFKFNSALESTRLAFTQLLGDGDKARAMLQRLAKTAQETPFGVTQLTRAARQMLAFGMEAEQVEKTMLAVGDAMAAMGGDEEMVNRVTLALGQMQAKGKVSAEELLQMTEAGIPATKILKEELDLTADQVENIGKAGIPAKVAIEALTKGMAREFKGAAEDQAKTWDGATSKIRDQYEQMTGAMTKSLFDETKKWLPEVQDTMDGIVEIWNREDLSFDEKFKLSRDVVDEELGPLFAEIERRLSEIDFAEKFAQALNMAIPVVAEAAGTMAIEAAKAFASAFMNGEPVTRLLLGGWLISKAGGFAAWRAYGATAGATMAAGATTGATTGAAATGWVAGAKRMGMRFGAAAGIAAAIAFAPDFIRRVNSEFKGKTLEFDLPKQHNLVEQIPLLGPMIGGLVNDLGRGEDALRDFGDTAEESFNKLLEAKDSQGLSRLGEQAETMAGRFPEAREELLAFANEAHNAAAAAGDAGGEITNALAEVAEQGGKHLTDIRGYTARAMIVIKRRMGEDSAAAKDALARNFHEAAEAVRASMKAGEISTKTGLKEIRKLMVKSLELYGISAGAAKALVAKQQSSSYGSGGLARGGLVQVGQPGEAGRDDVPALLNGRPHVIARGENVAVFTRHQKQVADQQLAGMGGLSGLFSSVNKPNYMARGGFVQGASARGLTGPVLAFAQKLFARGFNVTSAYRSTSNTFHGRGMALDLGDSVNDMGRLGRVLIPMRNQLAELFGPGGSWKHGKPIGQVPGHGDHWHVAIAKGVSGALGGMIDKIKRVKVPTDMGVVSSASQAAVDTARAAANKHLEDVAMAVDATHGPGQSAIPGGGNARANMALGRRLMARFFSGSQWGALRELWTRESGWNNMARNPSSGAFGIPQALPPGKMGAAAVRGNAGAQILWGLRYIKDRYGSPSAALAFHDRNNWYARGGMVQPFVGSYRDGGTIPQDGFAYVHKGEEVTPKQSGGFVGPHRRLKRLVGLPLDAEIRSGRTLEGFKGVLDDLEEVVPAHIASLQKRIREAMADLRKRGVTPKERQRYDQLKDALGSVDDEADRRLDLISDSINAAVDRAQDAISEVELRMRIEGIDNDSAQGLERIAAAQRALRDSINNQIVKVQRAIARAEREGRDEAEGQLREQLGGLQRSLLETTADLAQNAREHARAVAEAVRQAAEAARARIEAQIDARAFHVEGLRGGADLAVRQLELRQRLAGTQDTPEAMRARAAAVEKHTIPALQAQVGALWQNWLDLATAGFHGEAERVKREARSAEMDVLAAQVDAAELLRQAAEAQKQAAEENQRALNDLLKEQLQAERDRRRLAEAQFSVFAGFAGLAHGRLLGSFPHGAWRVPMDGLGRLHRNEMVIPDPQGPFQQTARQMTKPGPPPVVKVFVDGDIAPLMRGVRAEIDGRAARVVSEQLGGRARQFTTTPGR